MTLISKNHVSLFAFMIGVNLFAAETCDNEQMGRKEEPTEVKAATIPGVAPDHSVENSLNEIVQEALEKQNSEFPSPYDKERHKGSIFEECGEGETLTRKERYRVNKLTYYYQFDQDGQLIISNIEAFYRYFNDEEDEYKVKKLTYTPTAEDLLLIKDHCKRKILKSSLQKLIQSLERNANHL